MSRPVDADPAAPAGGPGQSLDPEDWEALRALGHRIVDDVIAYHRDVRTRPAWQPVPQSSRRALERPLPAHGLGEAAAYDAFRQHILPYAYGNIHPRAWGWVNGTGTTFGAFAELLGAAMNSNCWGGEHAAPYVEARVLDWLEQMVGFPHEASGLLVTGGSEANLIALAAARDARAGDDVGARGLHGLDQQLVVYGSTDTHNSVAKAVSVLGLGSTGLRHIPVDAAHRIDVAALVSAIAADRAAGRRPICVVATAGTVNTGAIDPLAELADICAREGMWLHVDGAFGALAALSPALRPLLTGMERADSLAFDLHKWLHIPIEAGVVFVRDAEDHRRPFSAAASYLGRTARGVASGEHFYSDLGPQLTRSFRAAKVWLSLVAHGTESYARQVEQDVAHARLLEQLIEVEPQLELLAPVPLNVVCYRFLSDGTEEQRNAFNRELLMRVQESGEAVPSGTVVNGRYGLRCAFVNHRTRTADVEQLVRVTLRLGTELLPG